MSKMTFVLEFENGKEPPVSFTENFMGSGGRLCSAAFYDYKDDYLSESDRDLITEALNDFFDEHPSEEDSDIFRRLNLLSE
ncbi:hypothetical protein QMZ93_07200 [Pantoea stewartii subsp. indologenes]|uniref:hypothetical protein n=1 Tax=Pantoea stewartii TaxID=66269 RepID=UPI0024DFFE89|nr:hypothetical protein [Pantoea stewartii]MDK2633128.1 hypothetical protein [Pantoea stewartii subsp. indologenes]